MYQRKSSRERQHVRYGSEFKEKWINKLTLVNTSISTNIQQLLSPHRRNRTLRDDHARNPHRLSHSLLLARPDTADEPHPQRLLGAKDASRQTDFLRPRERDAGSGQPRESADVGGDADVDFLHAEGCRRRGGAADSDVGCKRDVDGEAVGEAVEDCDDGCVDASC